MDDLLFSQINGWAILLGAALAWPAGRMIDRWGVRPVGTAVALGLGGAVVAMSEVTNSRSLFVWLLLVRGLGQGALSVVSMAMVGKWFSRRLAPAMGVYSVLLAFGFIGGTLGVGMAVQSEGWRVAWSHLGWTLILILASLTVLLVRNTPGSCGLQSIEEHSDAAADSANGDATLSEALRSPAFWLYSSSAALFGLIWAAITLFNQTLLEDRGFGSEQAIAELSVVVMAVLSGCGLLSNMLGGWLAMRWPMGRLMGLAMLMLAAALAFFPAIQTTSLLIAYAVVLGTSGGLLTVVYFAFYRKAFGQTHLGGTQGTAHLLSIVSSAAGPVLLTGCHETFGSFDPFFWVLAPVFLVLGLATWRVPVPDHRS